MPRSILPLLFTLGACAAPATAIIDGREVPRLDLDLTGEAFVVHHKRAHPRPGGPSGGVTGPGGDMVGQICGMQVDYEARHEGDHVQLIGAVDGSHPSSLAVRDQGGAREITGNIGGLGVELKLTSDGLSGHVGLRVLLASQQGGDLVGDLRVQGWYDSEGKPGITRVILRGRDALWSMPAADQAAILPNLLTCQMSAGQRVGASLDELEVAFGVPTTFRASQTSSLYRRGH
ncbi:MAG: hypothetical protein EXR72_03905 [Myxococcales bacterium]|nr:hypothetical protein [Myxococcales bacterium]